MRRLLCVLCLLSAASLQAAQTAAAPKKTAPDQQKQRQKIVANDADLAFAFATAESAIRQYNALPEEKKAKLEARVAKSLGVQDVAGFSADMRAFAATAKTKPIATKENRAAACRFLNANPKWCATLKATRITRRAMEKIGMKGEMPLDDIVNLIPE